MHRQVLDEPSVQPSRATVEKTMRELTPSLPPKATGDRGPMWMEGLMRNLVLRRSSSVRSYDPLHGLHRPLAKSFVSDSLSLIGY